MIGQHQERDAVAALAATRSLQSLLFGVSPTEPLVFVAAAGVLGGVAIVASWIPARTVTQADPLQANQRLTLPQTA